MNSQIDSIKPFAFNILNNNAYLFKMDNVQIQKIEAQVKLLISLKIYIYITIFNFKQIFIFKILIGF